MANTAVIRDAYGVPAMFVGSKTGRDDALFLSESGMKSAGCDGPNNGPNGMHSRHGVAHGLRGQPSIDAPGINSTSAFQAMKALS